MFNTFQSSVMFHIETVICFALQNKMTGFYMKHNTELQLVKPIEALLKLLKV